MDRKLVYYSIVLILAMLVVWDSHSGESSSLQLTSLMPFVIFYFIMGQINDEISSKANNWIDIYSSWEAGTPLRIYKNIGFALIFVIVAKQFI